MGAIIQAIVAWLTGISTTVQLVGTFIGGVFKMLPKVVTTVLPTSMTAAGQKAVTTAVSASLITTPAPLATASGPLYSATTSAGIATQPVVMGQAVESASLLGQTSPSLGAQTSTSGFATKVIGKKLGHRRLETLARTDEGYTPLGDYFTTLGNSR